MSALYRNAHVSRDLYQRGHGLGSILSSLFRGLKPVGRAIAKAFTSKASKRVGRELLRQGKKAGMNAVSAAMAGEDVGASLKKDFKTARKAVGKKARYHKGDGLKKKGGKKGCSRNSSIFG